MTNKEKHLKKLKKLLALGRNNSSQQEAALALNRAQALMTRHNLNINDDELNDINMSCMDKLMKYPVIYDRSSCAVMRIGTEQFTEMRGITL